MAFDSVSPLMLASLCAVGAGLATALLLRTRCRFREAFQREQARAREELERQIEERRQTEDTLRRTLTMFQLLQDVDQGHKRWVVVGPAEGGGAALLLARASDEAQRSRIGNQTGGRVGFFLHTDDFHRDHAAMLAAGVQFLEAPREEPYATVAVFRDLYGNTWDLLEPRR